MVSIAESGEQRGEGREFGAVAKALKLNPMNCSTDSNAHPDSDSRVCGDPTANVYRG
jgi:hypothetical protein